MAGAAEYKGVVWPVRMNSDGNYERGTRSQTIRSDIRMIFKGRRYVNQRILGDRLMRPGFGSIFPQQILKAFDPDVLIPVSTSEAYSQLAILEKDSLVKIDRVYVSSDVDGALSIAIEYTNMLNNQRDTYSYEIDTESPR